jgi:hypothetical protein
MGVQNYSIMFGVTGWTRKGWSFLGRRKEAYSPLRDGDSLSMKRYDGSSGSTHPDTESDQTDEMGGNRRVHAAAGGSGGQSHQAEESSGAHSRQTETEEGSSVGWDGSSRDCAPCAECEEVLHCQKCTEVLNCKECRSVIECSECEADRESSFLHSYQTTASVIAPVKNEKIRVLGGGDGHEEYIVTNIHKSKGTTTKCVITCIDCRLHETLVIMNGEWQVLNWPHAHTVLFDG